MSYYGDVLCSLVAEQGIEILPRTMKILIVLGIAFLCRSLRDPYAPLPNAVQETLWIYYWREFARKLEVF